MSGAEADLAAGELACPECGGRLRRWGHARARDVRDQGATTLRLRPRRARCESCGATYVLLLGAVLPRRADSTAVIGAAAPAEPGTGGSRPGSGARLPPCAAGFARSATLTTSSGCAGRASGGSPGSTARSWPPWGSEPTRLGEALTAAAMTVRARLTPHVPPWTLIGQFTGGRLVAPAGTG